MPQRFTMADARGSANYVDCLFSDLEALESQAGIHEIVFGLHRKFTRR